MTGIAQITPRPSLQRHDGHFLAGFIEAEGCFEIRQNNGGVNWSCVFTLVQRDDDTELLLQLCELTGLGSVGKVRATGNSKPQGVWSIRGQRDCLGLAQLLDAFPLRGRKRRELAVWAAAARQLNRTVPAAGLPQLAADLRVLKRYVNPVGKNPPGGQSLDDNLVAWLGGCFTGEGHLSLHRSRARVVVRLRDDDRPLLEELHAATGLGRLYSCPRAGRTCPSVAWVIYRQDQLEPAAYRRGRERHDLAIH